jgi:hypothetical protein
MDGCLDCAIQPAIDAALAAIDHPLSIFEISGYLPKPLVGPFLQRAADQALAKIKETL